MWISWFCDFQDPNIMRSHMKIILKYSKNLLTTHDKATSWSCAGRALFEAFYQNLAENLRRTFIRFQEDFMRRSSNHFELEPNFHCQIFQRSKRKLMQIFWKFWEENILNCFLLKIFKRSSWDIVKIFMRSHNKSLNKFKKSRVILPRNRRKFMWNSM